jgi:Methyltransferase domain
MSLELKDFGSSLRSATAVTRELRTDLSLGKRFHHIINKLPVRNLVPNFLRSGGVVRDSVSLIAHLLMDYGWLRSRRAGHPLDAHGQPIPWFTYPAVDFLKQLDMRDKIVFEYGSGYSTIFWAKRVKAIASVEHDKQWFEQIAPQVPPNTELILVPPDIDSYVGEIAKHGMFDVIVIDGTGESRLPCAEVAPKYLKPGGFVILDNSDLWPKSAAALRNADLIQIDFTGFAPLCRHWQTTSVFLSRQYSVQPINGLQPHKSVAQPAKPWPGV